MSSSILQIDLTLFGQGVEGINIPIGSTVLWTLRLEDPVTRFPVNLTGSTVTMSMADLDVRNHPVQPPIISRDATVFGPPANGVCTLPWVDGDTAPLVPGPLSPGRYALDVWLKDVLSQRQEMLVNSFVELTPIVTLLTSPSSPPAMIGGGGNVGLYSCPSGVAVLDAVYSTGADTVDKAIATSVATLPAIGFVLSKPTITTAVVQYDGELAGFTGLIPDMTYFLSTTAGQIAKVGDAGFPISLTQCVQRLAFAKNTTTLVIETDRDFIVL